jgi:hypothetical protein
MSFSRTSYRLAAVLTAALIPVANVLAVDGLNIPSEYPGSLVATQANATSFGDAQTINVGPVSKGSELDALYVTYDANDVWIGITGNLPNADGEGQTIVLLIDAQSNDCPNFPFCPPYPALEGCCFQDGSCQVISPTDCIAQAGTRLGRDSQCGGGGPPDANCNPPLPGALNVLNVSNMLPGLGGGHDAIVNLSGTILEPGFYPERAIAINRFGDQTYIDSFYLLTNSQDCLWPSNPPPDCFGPELVGPDPNNGLLASVYMDTTNIDGVDADNTQNNAGQEALAATAVKGLRVRLNRQYLGAFETEMKLQALLVSPDGTISNQILPSLEPAEDPHLAPAACQLHRPGDQGTCLANAEANFEALSGTQVVTLAIDNQNPPGGPGGDPALIHTNIPAAFGAGNLKATQKLHTSYGNTIPGNIVVTQGGSELDQMFVRTDDQFLHVAVTGNLGSDGNKLILFIDDDPAVGEHVLDSNGSPTDGFNWLRGWEGRTFDTDFSPEYAYVVNNAGNTFYADHYRLLEPNVDPYTNVKRYLGSVPVGSGSGVLTGGTNTFNDEFAFNNSNDVGVLAINNPGGVGLPATANSGLEARISLAEIGIDLGANPCPTIKVMAILGGTDGSYLSNQFLASLAPDTNMQIANEATGAPKYNFSSIDTVDGGMPAFAGDQFATTQLRRLGDIVADQDCCINAADIAKFVEILLGTETDPVLRFRADMNQDGLNNGNDAQLFVDRAIAEGPCP